MTVDPLHSECPHCRAKLQVDPISGSVVSFDPPPETMAEAQREADSAQPQRRKDAFESALNAERNREKNLDDLFRKASQKQQGNEEGDRADNPLDDRWR
jgi:hypothetical protein